MTPEELTLKVDELRAFLAEKLVDLEDDPKWGTAEEREELAVALETLADNAAVMRDVLQRED